MEKRIFMVIEMKNEVNNTDTDGLTIISESFRSLRELAKKKMIFFDDVPEKFRPDLHDFVIGETLTITPPTPSHLSPPFPHQPYNSTRQLCHKSHQR